MTSPTPTRARHRLLGRLPLCGLLLVLLVGCGGGSTPIEDLSGQQLVEALRDGGYVLLLRHTETSEGGIDALASLGDCAAQRSLTEAGRQDARDLGAAVEQLGVPVGRVLASPFCRTTETAELAFGRAEPDRSLLALASVGDDGSPPQERALAAARALAASPPETGTNTWLAGHISTITPLTGASPAEGGTVVLRPDAVGGFDVVGEVSPGGWPELAAAAG